MPPRTVEVTAADLPAYIAGLPRLMTEDLEIFVSGDVTQHVNITGFYGPGSLWIYAGVLGTYQRDAAVVHKLNILDSTVRVCLSGIHFEDSGLDNDDALLDVKRGQCEIYECGFVGKRAETNKAQYAIRSYRNSVVCSADILEISGFYMAGVSGYSSILSIHSGLGEPMFQGNTYGVYAYRGGAAYLSGSTPDTVGGATNQKSGGMIVKGDGTLEGSGEGRLNENDLQFA